MSWFFNFHFGHENEDCKIKPRHEAAIINSTTNYVFRLIFCSVLYDFKVNFFTRKRNLFFFFNLADVLVIITADKTGELCDSVTL